MLTEAGNKCTGRHGDPLGQAPAASSGSTQELSCGLPSSEPEVSTLMEESSSGCPKPPWRAEAHFNLGGLPRGLSPIAFLQAHGAQKCPHPAVQQETWAVEVSGTEQPSRREDDDGELHLSTVSASIWGKNLERESVRIRACPVTGQKAGQGGVHIFLFGLTLDLLGVTKKGE